MECEALIIASVIMGVSIICIIPFVLDLHKKEKLINRLVALVQRREFTIHEMQRVINELREYEDDNAVRVPKQDQRA